MTRLVFPDEGSRLVYRALGNSLVSAAATAVTFYTDATATVLADIRVNDGTNTPGAGIAGSALTTDAYSRIPLFWGPDAVDTVWAVVSGGPASPVYARTDDRLDAMLPAATAATLYAPRLLTKNRQGLAQPIATPSAGLTFQSVPHGVYVAAASIGVDGAVYSRSAGVAINRSTDSMQVGNPTQLFDISTAPGYAAGDSLAYVTRTSEGYVAITNNGDTGKIWFTAVAAGTSGWAVVQATRGLQAQAMAKPKPGPDNGKTLLLFGEYAIGPAVTPRNLWMSRDGGATWASISQTKLVNGATNSHCHGSVYDPVRRRIWSSQGDGENAWFGYTDDFGKTWVPLPFTAMRSSLAQTDHPTLNTYTQPVALAILGERLIGTPDGNLTAGVWEFDIDTGDPVVSFALASGEVGFQQFGFTMSDGMNGREAYIAFPDTGSGSLRTYIAGTGDYGRSWWLLATLPWTGAGGTLGPMVGPDPAGWIYHKANNFVTFGTDAIQARTPTWTWSTAEVRS